MLHSANEIENVKTLLVEGLTRAEVGKRMGLSRSTICGMAFRLKRSGVELPSTRARVTVGNVRKPQRAKRTGKDDGKRPRAPKSEAVPLLEIGIGRCHWPVSGEGLGTLFCNASRVGSGHRSYCKFHHLRSIDTRTITKLTVFQVTS